MTFFAFYHRRYDGTRYYWDIYTYRSKGKSKGKRLLHSVDSENDAVKWVDRMNWFSYDMEHIEIIIEQMKKNDHQGFLQDIGYTK